MNAFAHTFRHLHLLASPLLGCVLVAAQAIAAAPPLSAEAELGRRIYLSGERLDGAPIQGSRADVGKVVGKEAACVNCHRRSGLGTTEGSVVVPPITGRALFNIGDPVIVRADRRFDKGTLERHGEYTEEGFIAAVRDGIQKSGKPLHSLMPRYRLSDKEFNAVSAYLKTLSINWSPGITATDIHLATVITPDTSPEARKVFLDTLNTLVGQINTNLKSGLRQKIPAIERQLKTRRKLDVEVWKLEGPSSTWSRQLEAHYQAHPVFALVSGLGHDNWQPIQDFCEANAVACWFPSVDQAPRDAAQSRFSLYFSAGAPLEASLLAKRLEPTKGRVLQLVSADPTARAAAHDFIEQFSQLAKDGRTTLLEVGRDTDDAIRDAMAKLGHEDSAIAWLRPSDLAHLEDHLLTKANFYVAGSLIDDDEAAVPDSLRGQTTLLQRLEKPALRHMNVDRVHSWLEAMQIPVQNMRMQSEISFAIRSFVSISRSMLHNMHVDYLIERAEDSLSMFETMQVLEELQMLQMGPMNKRPTGSQALSAEQAAQVESSSKAALAHIAEMRKRGGTTVYPRLSLAPGQRFASKGLYLERLSPGDKDSMAEPEWVTP